MNRLNIQARAIRERQQFAAAQDPQLNTGKISLHDVFDQFVEVLKTVQRRLAGASPQSFFIKECNSNASCWDRMFTLGRTGSEICSDQCDYQQKVPHRRASL